MPTTSPDSIYYADGTTPASLADITSAMATSMQNAFNVREMQSFVWPNSTAKGAQTSMIIGDIGYQEDNLIYYRWNGSAWKIWATATQAYTPTITNFVNSARSFVFSVASGVVSVSGYAVCSGSVGEITISLPTGFTVNSALLPTSAAVLIGVGGVDDFSGSNNYPIGVRVVTNSSVALVAFNANSTYLLNVATGSNAPLSWNTGDVFNVNFSYPVA